MALQFWGDDRLVINERGGWQLREWPSGQVLQEGPGTAAPQPGGASIAVCADAGLSIDGEVVEPPISPVQLVRWYDAGHLLLVGGDNAARHLPRRRPAFSALPIPDHGPTAQVYGSHSDDAQEIWLLPLKGTPRRLRTLSPFGSVFSVEPLGDNRIGVTEYAPVVFGASDSWRTFVVSLDGRSDDLMPGRAGWVDGSILAPDRAGIAVRTCEDPGWWFEPGIIRDEQLHRPFPATMHMAGGLAWSGDSRLIITAYEGLRIGAHIEGDDQPLIPPTGTVHDIALRTDCDGVAMYNALGDKPTLHRITQDGLTPVDPVEHGPLSRLEIVSWVSDGLRLEGILALPDDLREPLPLVVWVRGGPSVFQTEHAAELDEWTSRGFAALAVNYRTSGIAGKRPMIDDLIGASEALNEGSVRDILAAVSMIQKRPEVDGDHVYAIGHSVGGYLVNRLVTRSQRMRAVVSWESAADLVGLDRQLGGNSIQRRWFGGGPSTSDRFAAGSPINDVASVQTPILLLAGENSLLQQMLPWYTALREAGVATELVVYRDEGHTMSNPANQKDLYDRSAAWFRRFR